jgi:beta-galactosidase
VVVAPALNVLPQAMADRLIAYVKQGGHLVLGPRTGMKDQYDALNPQRQPGPLVGLLGGSVTQFYALDYKVPVSGSVGSGTAKVWAETLSATSPETKVLMRYGASNGWLDGQPAVLERKVGNGSVTYIGAWLDAKLLSGMTADWLHDAGVEPIVANAPEGVEVCERTGSGKTVLILINHGTTAQHVALPGEMRDLLGEGTVSAVDLPKYGVAVLSK